MKAGYSDFYTMNYKEWILNQAGQIILLIIQIDFNKQVLVSFESESARDSLKQYRKTLVSSINEGASVMSKNLPNYKSMTVEALLTIMVYSRDTVTGLITNKIAKADNFEWSRHLRYAYDDANVSLSVMQSDSNFNYGFEYLGCSSRLVITPLTDRYFIR